MRCIIGQAHREMILKFIRPGTRLLEWGAGGSTLWLADRLPERATLTSVEHHAEWHAKVAAAIGPRDNVRLLLHEPTAPLGPNATEAEEDATPVQPYIHAVDGEQFDVILVDGVARNACMDRARQLLAPGGVVLLHDAHRDWYDRGKSLYIDHGVMGSCEDYASPLLWWGSTHPEQPRFSAAALPLIVSFYTTGTPYEQEAERLRRSCKALGLRYRIDGVPPRGNWEENCAYKARFIYDVFRQCDEPVLWVDADAVFHAPPMLLAGAEPDFAVCKCRGWQFASGTVYFNRTPLGRRLLERWVAECEDRPHIWDQIHLDTAWEAITARHPLRTMWLPQTYTSIFDMPPDERLGSATPVIEHFQASRRLKQAVSARPIRRPLDPDAELIAARRGSRARRCWYDDRFVLKSVDPSAAPWALRMAEPEEAFAAAAE